MIWDSVAQMVIVKNLLFPEITIPANTHVFASMQIPSISGYSFAFLANPSTNSTNTVLQSSQANISTNTAYIGCENVTSSSVKTTPSAYFIYIRTQSLLVE